MKIFIAGIMQGSLQHAAMHGQDYRQVLKAALQQAFPEAAVYDPLADHGASFEYGPEVAEQVFLGHNKMCTETDLLVAYVPEASMGTAIEMWEGVRHGRTVVAISPLDLNWVIRFCSHARYNTLEEFLEALSAGEIQTLLKQRKDCNPKGAGEGA